MTALRGSSKKATVETTAAPSVAPTIGINPRKPTATASTAAYGMSRMVIITHEAIALTVAMATWPIA